MYERIKAKIAEDKPETSRAGILELFDDYRRLDGEVHKLNSLSGAEAKAIMAKGREYCTSYKHEASALRQLRKDFVRTNSWHFMKNECYELGLW